MKKDLKYIIKRILIGVGIIFVMSFINSCNVHAETYGLSNQSTRIRVGYDNYINVNWNQNYWRGVAYDTYVGFDSKVELANSLQVLQEGRYLISFIVWSNQDQPQISCSNLSSNFKNINMTTGNLVQNEILSSCVDLYRVTYNNHIAWRILYEFTYKNLNGPGGITEIEFIVNSNNNFFNGDQNGLDLGFTISDIQDYDINVINTWNTDKSQQTIINGQQDIIYNQNNNTQSIINNQNTNTNSITNSITGATQQAIDNANQNTEKEIESQQVCQIIDKNNIVIQNKYLNGTGVYVDNNYNFGTTDYIDILNSKIKVLAINQNGAIYYCFYNSNKTLISCNKTNTDTLNSYLNIPNNSKYVRFTIYADNNTPIYEICKNGNQAMNDSINDLNDNITDSSIPSDSESKINNITSLITQNQNSNIVQLATFFPQLLQMIINGMNTNCTGGYSLGSLYGTQLTIPCINPVDYLGATIWGTIDAILCLCYLIPLCKFLVNKYNDLTSLNNLRWG